MPIDVNTFDPTKFKAEILTEVNTTINTTVNGASKTLKSDIEKMLEKFAKPPDVPIPDKKDEPPLAEAKTIAELNAQINAMKNDLKKAGDTVAGEQQLRIKAEADKKESERVNTFNRIISGPDFIFATPKAKEQFEAAYLGRVAYDEEGNLIIKGKDGTPMEMATYLKTEYSESTHLQPVQSRPGSGITPGSSRSTAGKGFSFKEDMTPSEIAALPAEQKAEFRAQINDALLAHVSS